MTLSAHEQYMLELINRARLDPAAEAARYGVADLNAGLAPGTITATAKQVLAPNDFLDTAATGHTQWMLANDIFDHIGAGGSNARDRIAAAGYAASDYFWGENLGQYGSSTAITDLETVTAGIHQALFESAGHRVNILRAEFAEIGLGLETGIFTSGGTDYNAALVTQNFAQHGSDVFLTGVTYSDTDKDRFYSVGEAVANVTFAIGATSAQTAAAGGYALEIAPGANQTVTVTPAAGAASTVVVDLSAGNVKLDLVDGTLFRSSGNLTLVSGVANAELLGIADLSLTGNAENNTLWDNGGANTIAAGGGNDLVYDRGGHDNVDLGDGNDSMIVGGGLDTIAGGAGIDTINYLGSTAGVNIDLFTNAVSGGWAAGDTISGFERVYGSNTGNDILKGTNGSNILRGYGGNDIVYDRAGNDNVDLGSGNDTVLVGNGADTLTGGAGIDNVNYYYSSGGVSVDLLTNALSGGWAADDTISGFERVYGSNTGNDTLRGTNGDNFLRGYGGKDVLHGRAGNDFLEGGAGADTVSGGFGADHFIFQDGFGADRVNDFSLADSDVLRLDDALWADRGSLTAAQVVSTFATAAGGDVVFDFGDGNVLTLVGLTDTTGLDAQIVFV